MDGRLEDLLRLLRSAGGGGDDSDSDSGSAGGSSSSSSNASSDSGDRVRAPKSFPDLKKQFEVFSAPPPRPFRPGDVVMWKEGCANRKRPKADEYGVVIEVLDEPLYGKEKSAGSPYFHEPLDLVIGLLDSDGDLVRYCYDKRRFCLAPQPSELDPTSGMSTTQKMQAMALDFAKPLELNVGDPVMLKPGFRHRRMPDYNTVAVVAEIVEEPFRDKQAEEGTSSFYELINGRIAFLDSDGDLTFLYVDLRRFRKLN